MHPDGIFCCVLKNRAIAVRDIAGVVCIELSFLDLDPCTGNQLACPIITCSIGGFDKRAQNESALIVEGVGIGTNLTHAGMCLKSSIVEIVIITAYDIPAGYQLAEERIVARIFLYDKTGIGVLANIDTVLAKIIVQTVCLANAGISFTVFIVSITTVNIYPTILQRVD